MPQRSIVSRALNPSLEPPARRTVGDGSFSAACALDLVGELAERAHRAAGDLTAARALVERDRLGALEGGAGLVEEPEEEVVLRPGGSVLHPVERLLVRDGRRAARERALVDEIGRASWRE